MKIIYKKASGEVLFFCPASAPVLREGQALHVLTDSDKAILTANKGAKFAVVDGALTVTAPYVAPVPSAVSLWALRAVLREDGLLDTILNSSAEAREFLEYRDPVKRKSPELALLNITDLDGLFRRAGAKKL